MNKFQLKHEFGFGEINKDTNEFAYKMTLILKDKCKNLSVLNTIKNGARIISKNIINIFMDCFIDSYLKEIKSDDNKTFLDNSINGCFSNDLKQKVNSLIKELKAYQDYKYKNNDIRKIKNKMY